jgi:hypothetical protein
MVPRCAPSLTIAEIVKQTGTEQMPCGPVTAVWPPNYNCLFPDRPKLAPRAVPVRRQTFRQVGASSPHSPTAIVRCMGGRPLLGIEPANGGTSIPRATSLMRRASPSCGRAEVIKKEAANRRPQAEGRMPMRASARERAHIGTLTSRSVENVKGSGLAAGWRSRFIGLSSRLGRKSLHRREGRLEITPRLGCRPACPRGRGPTAENKPTEPGRACPVKGVRH